MADPFGDQDSAGGAGKRPSPTIEGTATEISVEPEDAAAAPVAEPQGKNVDEGPARLADTTVDNEPPPARASVTELKSFVTHLAAGMLGGLIGVVGLAFAWGALDLGGKQSAAPDVSALEARLAKLESTPPPSGDSETLASLDARLKAIEDRPPDVTPEVSGLPDRVAQLEATMKTLAETAKEGGSIPDAAALSEQVGEAERRLQAKIDVALAEAEMQGASTVEAIQREIAELKAKLGALAEAELGTGDKADFQPELAALGDRIAKLESELPDLAASIGKDAAQSKSAALAIAFANLRAAVAAGRPYTAELATLNALSPNAEDLGSLPAFAGKGIPTLPELTRSFVAAKDTALAVLVPNPDDSFFGSLLASAQGLIKIRRVDAAATGEGPDAVLARAEAKLDQGDLAASVKEVEALDGAQRSSFSAWLDQARARLGADDTLKRLEGLLLVAVGGGAGQRQDSK